MVVIQFGGRTVKGYSNRQDWPTQEELTDFTHTPPIRLLDSGAIQQIPVDGVKAIFFVKSFEGRWHDDLRFHDHLAPLDCIWVRATFQDGEVIEGLIMNDTHYVLQPGFYMFPIDPEGNNLLMFVLKKKLKGFQVLGLRPAPRTMPRTGAIRPTETLA